MLVLLSVVGAVLVFWAGWAFGRAETPEQLASLATPSEPQRPDPAELIEELPTGVIVSDREGRVTFRNAAADRLAGSHVGVLIDDAIDRHLARGRVGLHSEEIVEFYGPPTTSVVVQARPLASGGSVVYVDDISERRRIEQVRTDFVANISHELRTPIGALSILAETLVDETDPELIHRMADRMMSEASRASRTIDDLLELSRIELGGESTVEPVKVSDIVSGAIERVSEVAARRGIAISVLDPVDDAGRRSVLLEVEGDMRQLVSAVGNLVENAVKYSEPGSSVQVKARANGGWVEITVTDQGVGIPQRDLDRIFERFYRVDRARSRETGGTGLGLSIVRHAVNNHDGEILVTSTEGEGSSFVIRLPPLRRDAEAGEPGDRSAEAPESSEGVA